MFISFDVAAAWKSRGNNYFEGNPDKLAVAGLALYLPMECDIFR